MSTSAPTELGQWRFLDLVGRREWLGTARETYFDPALEQHRVGKPGEVFTIEGRDICDLPAFFCAIGEAINGPRGYFGANMNGFDDCLFGGFGLEAPCTIVWRNADVSRRMLGSEVLAEYCEQCLESIDGDKWPSDLEEDRRAQAVATLERARLGQSTMFDELVSTIESVESRFQHKPGWRIELILE